MAMLAHIFLDISNLDERTEINVQVAAVGPDPLMVINNDEFNRMNLPSR